MIRHLKLIAVPVAFLVVAVVPAAAQWQREWQSGNLGQNAWGASYGYDIDSDGVPNLWTRASGQLIIYNSSYGVYWTISFSGYDYPMLVTPRDIDGDGIIRPVNMDGDASGEVVATAYRISGSDIYGRVRVYDASSRQLEWESAELAGFSGSAAVDDVDGDSKHEIIITRYSYSGGWGYVEVYGSSAAGVEGGGEYELEQSEPVALPAISAGSTSVRFEMDKAASTRLSVFDRAGRVVRTVLDAVLPVGEYAIRWDGLNDSRAPVTAGVYFYRLERGTDVSTGNIVIAR